MDFMDFLVRRSGSRNFYLAGLRLLAFLRRISLRLHTFHDYKGSRRMQHVDSCGQFNQPSRKRLLRSSGRTSVLKSPVLLSSNVLSQAVNRRAQSL